MVALLCESFCGDMEALDGEKRVDISTERAELCRGLPFYQMESGRMDKGLERLVTIQSGRFSKEFFCTS